MAYKRDLPKAPTGPSSHGSPERILETPLQSRPDQAATVQRSSFKTLQAAARSAGKRGNVFSHRRALQSAQRYVNRRTEAGDVYEGRVQATRSLVDNEDDISTIGSPLESKQSGGEEDLHLRSGGGFYVRSSFGSWRRKRGGRKRKGTQDETKGRLQTSR